MSDFLLTPPCSQEAEQAVLGGILFDSSVLPDVVDILKPEDFYIREHRDIFAAMAALFQAGELVEGLTVGEWLNDNGLLNPLEGRAYLMDLQLSVTTAMATPYHAGIVKKKSTLRKLADLGKEIQAAAYDLEDPDRAMEKAQSAILALARQADRQVDLSPEELAAASVERLIDQIKNPKLTGLSTGFPQVDRYLSGLQKGNLVILGARPNVGKSAFALNVATHVAAAERRPVLFYSLEMEPQKLADRVILSIAESTQNPDKIRAAQKAYPKNLFIIERPALSLATLRASMLKKRLECGELGLVVVDYLQLMHGPGNTMNERVSELSRGLKLLAREFNVPVLVGSQLSRKVEARQDKRPMCSDLRDSGAIEQDADIVILLHRDDVDNNASERPNVADVIIAKNRSGPTGEVELQFRKTITKFIDPEAKPVLSLVQAGGR